MIIYCDMDQVLVNFLGGAKKVMGKEFNDPSLGSLEDRWLVLRSIPDFWSSLEWMPSAKLLWDRIAHLNPRILSASPSLEEAPLCPSQKQEWGRTNLNIDDSRIHIVMREDKQLYAVHNGVPNLLIDDHPRNIAEWREAGGVAIHHQTVPETLAALATLGILAA